MVVKTPAAMGVSIADTEGIMFMYDCQPPSSTKSCENMSATDASQPKRKVFPKIPPGVELPSIVFATSSVSRKAAGFHIPQSCRRRQNMLEMGRTSMIALRPTRSESPATTGSEISEPTEVADLTRLTVLV